MRGGRLSFIYDRSKKVTYDTQEQAAAKKILRDQQDHLYILKHDLPSVHPESIRAAIIAIEKAQMCVKNVAVELGVKF